MIYLMKSSGYTDANFAALEAILSSTGVTGSNGVGGWGRGHVTIPLQSSLARIGGDAVVAFLRRNPQATITLWGEHTRMDAGWLEGGAELKGRVFRDSNEPGALSKRLMSFQDAWTEKKNAAVPAVALPVDKKDTEKSQWEAGERERAEAEVLRAERELAEKEKKRSNVVVAQFDGKGKVNLTYAPREKHLFDLKEVRRYTIAEGDRRQVTALVLALRVDDARAPHRTLYLRLQSAALNPGHGALDPNPHLGGGRVRHGREGGEDQTLNPRTPKNPNPQLGGGEARQRGEDEEDQR